MIEIPPVPPAIDLDNGYRLRAIHGHDAEAMFAYLSDTRVTELTSYDVRSRADIEAAIAALAARHAERACCRWAVARVPDDVMIGACGFNQWSLPHAWAELAYELAPEYWGKGIITRAVSASLDWAFDTVGFNRVHAFVMAGNERSLRVLDRAGFQREGLLRGFRLCRSVPRDFWVYALLATEQRSRPGAALGRGSP